jgi:hypothetical protein
MRCQHTYSILQGSKDGPKRVLCLQVIGFFANGTAAEGLIQYTNAHGSLPFPLHRCVLEHMDCLNGACMV